MHSGLELKIPPPLQILTAALLMGGLAYWNSWPLPLPWAWRATLAAVLAVIGVAVLLFCGHMFIKAKTTYLPMRPEKSSALVTNGIYRYSRNPMYLSMAVFLLGVGILCGDVLALLVLPLFAMYMTRYQIIPEERALERLFGEAYRDYKRRTRRWV